MVKLPSVVLFRMARKRARGFLDAVVDQSRMTKHGQVCLSDESFNEIIRKWPEQETIRGGGEEPDQTPSEKSNCC